MTNKELLNLIEETTTENAIQLLESRSKQLEEKVTEMKMVIIQKTDQLRESILRQ